MRIWLARDIMPWKKSVLIKWSIAVKILLEVVIASTIYVNTNYMGATQFYSHLSSRRPSHWRDQGG